MNFSELTVCLRACGPALVMQRGSAWRGLLPARNRITDRSASKIFMALLCLLAATTGLASGKKEWVKLADCRYVEDRYNDGDSFHVLSGTNEFIVRLYFVDAPETNLRYPERTREQSEYFGVTLDQTMKAGAEADKAVRGTLREPFGVWTRWASAAGRSKDHRYYGMVEVNGKDLGELLVSRGLARTKGVSVSLPRGEKARAEFDKLRQLESDAKTKRAGIWAHSAPPAQEGPVK